MKEYEIWSEGGHTWSGMEEQITPIELFGKYEGESFEIAFMNYVGTLKQPELGEVKDDSCSYWGIRHHPTKEDAFDYTLTRIRKSSGSIESALDKIKKLKIEEVK